MGFWARADMILLGQRGHLFCWAPVFFALGIGGFFALRFEPGAAHFAGACAAAAVLGWLAWRRPSGLSALGWAGVCLALGFCAAGWRAHHVAAPVLVLTGTDGPDFLRESARDVHAALPQSRLVEFDGVSHSGPGEAPARVAAEVDAFRRG